MSDTTPKYIVQVDAKGIQRLCLANEIPIPSQVESTLYQNTEQARKGLCTFSVLVYCQDSIGFDASDGIKVIDSFSFQMPDGTICDADHIIKRQSKHGTNSAQIIVSAKMIPTIQTTGSHADIT